jgi:hypothetical protein
MYEPEVEGGEMDAAPAPEMDAEIDMDMPAEEPVVADDMEMEGMMDDAPVDTDSVEEDLELEAIIRELEEDLNEEEQTEEDIFESNDSTDLTEEDKMDDDKKETNEEFNIDEIIEGILSEDEEEKDSKEKVEEEKEEDESKEKVEEMTEELTEAYDTIESLRGTINEVNLLNAKLLYTNKLFRNFELSESQKMTVIENFDRAGNTREVKLVFSTLAENFTVPVKKRKVVKEGTASKAINSTAPATKTIINEGNELANRWKKLAGLLS